MMVQRSRLRALSRRCAAPLAVLLALIILGPSAVAQEYTCFPTCSTVDGRFLALAGAGLNTFAGDEIRIGIGMPSGTTHLEIGIFDGETGGMWDIDTMPLRYKLYADPTGDGRTDTVLIQQWLGNVMTENDWYTIRMENLASARSTNGNYVYFLNVEATDTVISSTSSFKVRTTGTVTVRSHQAFSIYAAVTDSVDIRVIYPNFPSSPAGTTYDGTWKIYLDVPTASSKFSIWDGDMDYGSWDGATKDTDDPNTGTTRPEWATPAVRSEGVAISDYPVISTTRTGYQSGDPADDNRNITYRKTPSIYYQVITPNNVVYQNLNPSGNLEWENFVIDTAAYDQAVNDIGSAELPPGIYTIRIVGMDLANVNAWRFFNDVVGTAGNNNEVLGVNILGNPVIPIRAAATSTDVSEMISGIIYYDSDGDGVRDNLEPGIPSVRVTLTEYDASGAVIGTTVLMTDEQGSYFFPPVSSGSYTVTVDATTLQEDVVATYDADGATTAHTVSLTVPLPSTSTIELDKMVFGYKRTVPVARTRGYWVNHPENWPTLPETDQKLRLGNDYLDKLQCLEVLQRPTKGDKTYSLASQLIATKLNILSGGNTTCIAQTVIDADAWLSASPINCVTEGSCDPAWTTGSPTGNSIHTTLDDYNNGRLCEGHMD